MPKVPFEGKAPGYRTYRPDYAGEAIRLLLRRAGLTGRQTVADLGSGTGLLTRHLLRHARLVYAVEPLEEMRREAEASFASEPKFRSTAGTAEATGLPSASVDAVVCGNSFHYFEPVGARGEVLRILRPGGRVVLLFHEPPAEPDAFMNEYLAFLQEMTPPELAAIHSPAGFERRLSLFFEGGAPLRERGEQSIEITGDKLAGLFSSSSIAPRADDPTYESSLAKVRRIFDRHQRNGSVPYRLEWRCVSAAM
jgi:SAM-dependent methyltransferase